MKKKQSILKKIIREKAGTTKVSEKMKWIIVAVCVLSDAVCFYTTYNLLLRESWLLNLFTVIITSLTIDLFPVVLATIMSRSKKNRIEMGMVVSIAFAFICEAAMSFFIRYNTKDLLFKSGGLGLELSDQAGQNLVQTSSGTTSYAEIGVVILLGIIPILTSLLSFAVSYENPERRKNEKREELLIDLKEEIHRHQVNIQLLDEDLKNRDLIKLDRTRFKIANMLVDLSEIGEEIKGRQVIATQLSDTDATTILTEDPEIQEKVNTIRKRLEKLTEEIDYNEEETDENNW